MLNYETYLDKLYGCFLGKTVVGTMGAPFEGIKMPLEMPFKREMIDAMLPNDDLDLQVLWLDVAEEYGEDFTPYDLLSRFVSHCDYSPGEYAVMRKNFERGIYPPLSGRFCNDYYISGMGCPIRSEIWACLAPLQPDRAADFASRDGVLDHEGESVYAERFFAALEAAAFGESDLDQLIEIGLSVVPVECRFRQVVTDTVALCRQYDDIKVILRKILFRYGHPDCTNLFQNMGITIAALYKGNPDLIKTGMDALNCGFDTDCTCATAGAVLGLIRGAKSLIEEYNLGDVRFVLGVRSERRSDSVRDLSEDIAHLGVVFNPGLIEGAPAVSRTFRKAFSPLAFEVFYENDDPTVTVGGSCRVSLHIRNTEKRSVQATVRVRGLGSDFIFGVSLHGGGQAIREMTFSVPADAPVLAEKNLIDVTYETGEGLRGSWQFGIVGCTLWKAIGPIWKTDPVCTTEALLKVPNYWHLMNVPYDGDSNDVVRRFHLNFAVDTQTEYLTPDTAFSPLRRDDTGTAYEETLFSQKEDSFRMDDICGMIGPSVIYLARELYAEADTEVCAQIGHSAPFALFINGKKIAERHNCDTWDAENVHIQHIQLHKGVNRILFRLTRVNADAKFNLTFSKGPTCADHFVEFGSVNPLLFGTV